ncbi:MAG: hypothetical protein M1821_003440 [Bathelium mastoideum]|nr:MAG: hypothetical protein M1821_003440 [Bathelium mastoideum]
MRRRSHDKRRTAKQSLEVLIEERKEISCDKSSVHVPGTGLSQSILASNTSRADWTQRLTGHIYDDRYSRRYNVITVNTEIDYEFAPEEVIDIYQTTYSDPGRGIIHYESTVFKRGYFIRLGDGGYINWCFQGNYDRNANAVQFKDIETND